MGKDWPVYLYIPNIIGYMRVVCNMAAFAYAFENKALFVGLYFASFVCDDLDGRAARFMDQCSTFGAVLDMVTDRLSTAGLLVILSRLYPSAFLACFGLIALDLASHWFQMYSSLLEKKSSHKDVSDSQWWVLRCYYRYRLFMGYCCVGAEVLYLTLYLLHDPFFTQITVPLPALGPISVVHVLAALSLPGFIIKQFVNVVQMKSAADVMVQHDVAKKSKAT